MHNIIITNTETKKTILKNNNKLIDIKIYTLNEFINLYYFSYNEETIYYLINKYHYKYEIAKIYLDNLTYIVDIEYKNPKLNFLKELKKELIANKLLYTNKLFKNNLQKSTIYLYNLPLTKEMNKLLEDLKDYNVIIKQDELPKYNHPIYELNTLEDEVVFVANKICELINDGTNINHIYLTNIDSEYKKAIKRIFPMYNIPVYLDNNDTLYGTYIVKLFLDNYTSNIEDTFNIIKDYIKTEEDQNIYNKLIDIVNKYSFIDDKLLVKEMIIYDLKNTKLETKILSDKVTESILDNPYTSLDYVFLMSFNQGIIPKTYKDEEYLNDIAKEELNISLTVDKNNNSKNNTIKNILSIPNLIITYKKEHKGEEYIISSINEELSYEITQNIKPIYNYSNAYNKLKLASLLDNYTKYNSLTDSLLILNKHYKYINYKTYNNKFTGLNIKDFRDYLNNKLNLSYTKLDTYYKCPFQYYVSNILKLNKYEETFYQHIGTIFHAVLEKITTSNLSYDDLFNHVVNDLNITFSNKEKFFLKKLKKELSFVIECIQEQDKYTNLKQELHEEKIYTSISGNMTITFSGIIDKLKYNEKDTETIIAIIDYKTGNPSLDLTTIEYGIGMQLPIYLYLAKNTKKLKNVKIAGIYLQKILHNEITVDKSTTYEQTKKKALKLQGYSNIDKNILSEFDNSYEDSKMIQGMKTTKTGDFIHYAKVLSNKQMDTIEQIVINKIEDGAHLIENAEFTIAPKVINDENYSCSYCKYKDICFHKNEDLVELYTRKLEDIIGGDTNETDTITTESH